MRATPWVFVVSLVLGGTAMAQTGDSGRYVVEYRPAPGNDMAWKLDTATGQIWTCATSMQRCQSVPNSIVAVDARLAGRFRFSVQGNQAWRVDSTNGRMWNCMASGCGPEKPE